MSDAVTTASMVLPLPERASRFSRLVAWTRRAGGPGYLYIAAAIMYLFVFVLYPMARSIWLSFTNTNILAPNSSTFVGLANYRGLFSSEGIGQSLIVTGIYVAGVTAAALLIGTASAFVLERVQFGRSLLRTLIAMPWMIPGVVIGLLFAIILDAHVGVLNALVSLAGFARVGWLTSNNLALFSVVCVTAWNMFPFVMLVVLAAMQSVPRELHESASLDGAGYWQNVRWVLLPSIMPTIRIASLFLVIWAFRDFQIIWLLTEGGPTNGTNVLVINLYRSAFLNDQLGSAAAIGVVGLLFSSIVTAAFFLIHPPLRAPRR